MDAGNSTGIHAPAVSVVIPYYNQPDYLADCVGSVLAQTFDDVEVVVVDDASPEPAAAAVLARAEITDPRVRSVRHDVNKGLGAARNTGFRAARAELLLPLDSDDMLDRLFLERTVSVLRDDAAADCVFADFQLFGLSDEVRAFELRADRDLLRGQWIPGPGVLMRRSLWQNAGGYPESPLFRAGDEDWDFWLGAAERGFSARHVPQALYRYRTHAGSMTSTTLSYGAVDTRKARYERHRPLFERHGGGRAFRAQGAQRSAVAARERGELRRALGLTGQSWLLTPFTPATLWTTLSVLAGARPIQALQRLLASPGRLRRAARRRG